MVATILVRRSTGDHSAADRWRDRNRGLIVAAIARSYVASAEGKIGEPVLAAGRFRRSRPETGGRKDWISVTMRVLSVAMAGRDSEVPRRVVVAVCPERIYLLRSRPVGVGPPVASWGRAQMRTSVERSGRSCRMWMQPPGDRQGFELRPSGDPADAVVDALATR